jgi:ketosteroid isomerase-like protein
MSRKGENMSELAIAAVNALGAAIGARDAEALQAIYDDAIVVWHGSTGMAQTKQENIALLAGVFKITSRLEYVDIRRHVIGDVVVQQHQLVGQFDDGTPIPALNACLVIKVRNRQIVSIEEYFDSETFAEVWARLAALSEA